MMLGSKESDYLKKNIQPCDMLVRLYDLPPKSKFFDRLPSDMVIRRARAHEMGEVLNWIELNFHKEWADECRVAFSTVNPTCNIAIVDGRIAAFGAYEVTCRNFAGPLGVAREYRGRHLAQAITWSALSAMLAEGYAYAVLGSVREMRSMFCRYFNAIPINGSSKSIYVDRLISPNAMPGYKVPQQIHD